MAAILREPPSEDSPEPETHTTSGSVQSRRRFRAWIGKPRSILSALLLWSGIGIAVGVIVEIIFAQMASGIWLFEWRLNLDSARWYDVTRSAIATVGLFGLGGAALLAYRRQHTAEGQHTLDKEKQALEMRKQSAADVADLRARYTAAAQQLGHERPAVRLAGVYALAALADDWRTAGSAEQQKVCVDVLCSYLRMAYDPESDRAKEGEKEVRLTIISVITAHLQDPNIPSTWCGLDLDFKGVIFDGGNFAGAKFTGGTATFNRAQFRDGEVTFYEAHFSGGEVTFEEAHFSGGEVTFYAAQFSGGEVSFLRSHFDGGSVGFDGSQVTGCKVGFEAAHFSGGTVSFGGARFSSGTVSFRGAQFIGGKVFFTRIEFSGAKVSFSHAAFEGSGISFWSECSSGVIDFNDATFAGGALFFRDALFNGADVSFRRASFTGAAVSFVSASFAAGKVDFMGCEGRDPGKLSFEGPHSWDKPPIVPWEDGPVPSWVRPELWPPRVESTSVPDGESQD